MPLCEPSLEVVPEERGDAVVGNHSRDVVVEVHVGGAGDDQQFLVAGLGAFAADGEAGHLFERVLAEVATVGLFAVDQQDGGLDFVRVGEQRHVEEGLAADGVPAVGRVAAAGMEAARRLVVGVVVLDEPRGVVGQRIDHAAGALVGAAAVVLGALGGHGAARGHALGGRVVGAEVALARDLRHVVHRRGDGRLDARVERRGVHRHAAPAADAEDADAPRVHVRPHRKAVHGGEEVLRVEVGAGHAARLAAALAGEGRVEGDREEAVFREVLRVEPARLLLDRAEGAADGDRRERAFRPLGLVEVGGELDAEAVPEGDLGVFDLIGKRERLVPFLRQLQGGSGSGERRAGGRGEGGDALVHGGTPSGLSCRRGGIRPVRLERSIAKPPCNHKYRFSISSDLFS